jgi:hypothetical protein
MAFMHPFKPYPANYGNKGFSPIQWQPQVMIHGSVMKLSTVVVIITCTAMAGRPL